MVESGRGTQASREVVDWKILIVLAWIAVVVEVFIAIAVMGTMAVMTVASWGGMFGPTVLVGSVLAVVCLLWLVAAVMTSRRRRGGLLLVVVFSALKAAAYGLFAALLAFTAAWNRRSPAPPTMLWVVGLTPIVYGYAVWLFGKSWSALGRQTDRG